MLIAIAAIIVTPFLLLALLVLAFRYGIEWIEDLHRGE